MPTPGWQEADRLAALQRYAILDAAVGESFDDFVRIAADVCEAPIALVSFMDEHRQWFAAGLGLGGVRETPRDLSVCTHALQQRDVFVVPDLELDARFAGNPLVTGAPGLRFYGGALLEADGLPLGTVCVLDTKPRPQGLTERQRGTLQALARQVMTQLDLRWTLARFAESEAAKDRLLAEKELLLGEVHHRVKNSLAMAQALLLLQARASKVPAVVQQLQESAGRIRTIAGMHEQLYRFGAASEIDLHEYLRDLLREQQASGVPGRAIAFAGDSVRWPVGAAPTVGLLVAELVTNALKYGTGTVDVTLRQTANGLELTVADEGTYLPRDFDPHAGTGFGMRLIRGLLSGQDGEFRVDRTRPQTTFVATLQRPDPPTP